jgi:Zn-dependent protease
MFGTRWQLFRLLGIPLSVDASWLVILALLAWTLANHFEEAVSGLTTGDYWMMGVGAALSFFACIVLHELGHAVVARKLGIPIRGITLFLFGGVAELEDEPKSARSEFLMAIAGPAVSAVLVLVLWALSQLGWPVPARVVLGYLAAINFAVLVFNLVPAFPLDGGRVLRSILWGAIGSLRRATYWASFAGQGFAWLLITLGVLNFIAGATIHGVWLGLIGMFLNNAAKASYQQVIVRQMLEGEPVSRFMNPEPIVVPRQVDLQHWVDDYVLRYNRKMFPVSSNGHVTGVIATDALAQFPRKEWSRHTVDEAMTQDLAAISVAPRADALEALGKMQQTGSSRLLVMEGDHLVGIISLKDLLRFLELSIELEQGRT